MGPVVVPSENMETRVPLGRPWLANVKRLVDTVVVAVTPVVIPVPVPLTYCPTERPLVSVTNTVEVWDVVLSDALVTAVSTP